MDCPNGMKVDNLVWRLGAKVVAYFSLFLSILVVLGSVLVTIVALTVVSQLNSLGHHVGPSWPLFLYLGFMDILAGVQFWASLKLICATENGMVAVGALEKSKIWLNVNAFVLGLEIAFYFVFLCSSGWPGTTIGISKIVFYVIYFIMMFVVCKFTQELDITVNSGKSVVNNVDCVYVK